MKKLNRNNTDIEKLRDKKVAVRLVGQDAEIDFRKWLEENGINFDKEDTLMTNGIINEIINEICYYVEGNSWDWCDKSWFIEKGYTLYEWEIAEEEKTYTIKDVVENAGKMYIDKNNNLYLYNEKLYCRTPEEKKFRPSFLNLKQMLDLKLTEYKLESKRITFGEAVKEMEKGKVCKSLYSGKEYLLSNNHFEKLNRNYTNLSYKEIKEEWVVVNE